MVQRYKQRVDYQLPTKGYLVCLGHLAPISFYRTLILKPQHSKTRRIPLVAYRCKNPQTTVMFLKAYCKTLPFFSFDSFSSVFMWQSANEGLSEPKRPKPAAARPNHLFTLRQTFSLPLSILLRLLLLSPFHLFA